MKKIGFLAMGPGSANCLFPLVEELKNRHEIKKIALHPYVAKKWGVKNKEELDKDELIGLDFLFYGTGSGHPVETHIPKIAKEMGIKTISIMDIHWAPKGNYKVRFPFVPEWIVVTNEKNKETLLKEVDIKKDRVLVFGNPHFDMLRNIEVQKIERNQIVFVSSPETNEKSSATSNTCKEAAKELLRLKCEGAIEEEILFCRHPRENDIFFKELGIKVEERGTQEVVMESMLNIGCGSTIQYESKMLGIPTVFYKKGKLLEDIEKAKKRKGTIKNAKKGTGTVKKIIEYFDL